MYYLNHVVLGNVSMMVLEDWIYLYYLNLLNSFIKSSSFLRIEFICIIWTPLPSNLYRLMFLRIEFICIIWTKMWNCFINLLCSWGLNLFVLFEHFHIIIQHTIVLEDWIYLYYLNDGFPDMAEDMVLEDWIYLYYLNQSCRQLYWLPFLRIEFICIIWTIDGGEWHHCGFLRIEFICIIWTIWVFIVNGLLFLRIEFICIIWTWKWEQVTKELF